MGRRKLAFTVRPSGDPSEASSVDTRSVADKAYTNKGEVPEGFALFLLLSRDRPAPDSVRFVRTFLIRWARWCVLTKWHGRFTLH